MIIIKNKAAISRMKEAGLMLLDIFNQLESVIQPGISTEEIDRYIDDQLIKKGMVSKTKGYIGYRHASCISVNDEVVHGVPHERKQLQSGDFIKVDICASYNGYCADMARPFFIGTVSPAVTQLAQVAQQALDKGIAQAKPGNRLSDISAAIQQEVERHGFGVVRDFAGHGIGKRMHEDPEILNYGRPGQGPVLQPGMTFAIEPMITAGKYEIYIAQDGWTVKTCDGSLAAHVEDTIAITNENAQILTRREIGN